MDQMDSYAILVRENNEFRALAQLGEMLGSLGKLFGVVTNFKPLRKSKKGSLGMSRTELDYNMTLTLADPSLPPEVKGLVVLVFKPLERDCPVVEIGDVDKFNGRLQGMFNRPYPQEIKVLKEGCLEMGLYESKIFTTLRTWWKSLNQSQRPKGPTYTSQRPVLKVKDLNAKAAFFDIYCKVLVKPACSSNSQTLFITDFTKNAELSSSSRFEDLDYPNDLVITCTLWDNNIHCDDILDGSYVFIRNAKTKYDGNGRLEVVCNGDTVYTTKKATNVLSPSAPEINNDRREQQFAISNAEATDLKVVADGGYGGYAPKKVDFTSLIAHSPASSQVPATVIEPVVLKNEAGVGYSKIEQLLDPSTQVPRKHLIMASIVDYLPHDIQNFSKAMCYNCDKSDCEPLKCPSCYSTDIKSFVYLFSLLLEDSTGHLPAILSGDEATKFMRNVPATPLRLSSAALISATNRINSIISLPKKDQEFRSVISDTFEWNIESYLALNGETRFKISNSCP